MSPAAAKRALETGRRLADQPEVAAAALAGDLSSEQATAVSDGVAADPAKAAELIDKAKRSSLPELNEEVAKVKAARSDQEQRRRDRHAKRSLRRWTDRDGALPGPPVRPSRRRRPPVADARPHPPPAQHPPTPVRGGHRVPRRPRLRRPDDHGRHRHRQRRRTRPGRPRRPGPVPPTRPVLAGRPASPAASRLGAEPELFPTADADPTPPTSTRPAPLLRPASKPESPSQETGRKPDPRHDPGRSRRPPPRRGPGRRAVRDRRVRPGAVSVVEDLLATENPFIIGILTKAQALVGVYHHGRHPNATNGPPWTSSTPPARPRAAPHATDSNTTTATTTPKPTSPPSTSSTGYAATTTARKPTTAGPWSKAPANGPSSHPTTPATPTEPTNPPPCHHDR